MVAFPVVFFGIAGVGKGRVRTKSSLFSFKLLFHSARYASFLTNNSRSSSMEGHFPNPSRRVAQSSFLPAGEEYFLSIQAIMYLTKLGRFRRKFPLMAASLIDSPLRRGLRVGTVM